MIAKDRIKTLAQEIGFDACGITLAEPEQEAERTLESWVQEGKHGDMAYLENYEERKQRFRNRFPEAKSVIVLGVNYFSEHKLSSWEAIHQPVIPAKAAPQGCCPPWSSPCGTGIHKYGSPIKTFGDDTSCPRNDKLTGRVARYAWGKDYHKVIARKLELLAQKIKDEAGSNCKIQFEPSVDTKPLLERTLAEKAGLGFIGKQTQLLSLQFGPWLFLGELVTNLDLEPDQPFSGSCGTCRLCIEECPTDAIEESGPIDARKCIAYLTIEHKSEIPLELRPKIENWVFGCDQCLQVCPYTAKQKETKWDNLRAGAGFGSELDLLKLFEIKSNGEYEKLFGETAISRANRKQLLRNACVVLGNVGTEKALSVLQKAAEDHSLLVREHAKWAIQRIEERIDNLSKVGS